MFLLLYNNVICLQRLAHCKVILAFNVLISLPKTNTSATLLDNMFNRSTNNVTRNERTQTNLTLTHLHVHTFTRTHTYTHEQCICHLSIEL